MMPELSGLDMVRSIRIDDQKTPVILMTSSIDNQVLVDAINLGVTRFIPKPFDSTALAHAIKDISKQIISERLFEKHRQQEIELLRYRDSYNSIQQEAAQRKEHHVVRHDLRNQCLVGAGGIRWGIEVAHYPRDIMSGDGFTVRKLPDNRLLIFVVDAMGSGLSASISSLLATSFCNYFMEHLLHPRHCGFEFRYFLTLFKEYLSGMLMEEEAISCGFFLVDLTIMKTDLALFALPPLLVRNLDGSTYRIKSSNPPFSKYTDDIIVSSTSIAEIADFLVVTDGVTDAELVTGEAYREFIEKDFRDSPTLAALQRRFQMKVSEEERDDQTLLHLKRLDLPSDWNWSSELSLSLEAFGSAISEALDSLIKETSLKVSDRDELEIMLTEALINALEHGCLGITSEEKSSLLQMGEYDEVLANRVPPSDSRISLKISLWRGAAQPLLILEIYDSGSGVPLESVLKIASPTAVCGRGLRLIGRSCDSLFIGSPGGCLLILKTLVGENDYAS
jgi:FixJ family two-component response regulator/anti-sigma regulatory factor (Ser/Thr protein kinase)